MMFDHDSGTLGGINHYTLIVSMLSIFFTDDLINSLPEPKNLAEHHTNMEIALLYDIFNGDDFKANCKYIMSALAITLQSEKIPHGIQYLEGFYDIYDQAISLLKRLDLVYPDAHIYHERNLTEAGILINRTFNSMVKRHEGGVMVGDKYREILFKTIQLMYKKLMENDKIKVDDIKHHLTTT